MSGPPAHIALALLAPAIGGKLTQPEEPDREELDLAPGATTIAELAKGVTVVSGGDTLAASRAILARLAASRPAPVE